MTAAGAGLPGPMRRLHRARWGAVIGRWLDGEADPGAGERVVAHLERCAGCRELLEQIVRIRDTLRRRASPVVSSG